MAFDAPNYTQLPNVLLDDLLKDLKEAELKVVLAIARKTFGWHKASDLISLTQLQKLTGLSRQGVLNGIAEGEKRGLIQIQKTKGGMNRYSLVVNEVDQQELPLVKQVDQAGQANRPAEASAGQASRHTKESKLNKELNKKKISLSNSEIHSMAEILGKLCKVDLQFKANSARAHKAAKQILQAEISVEDLRGFGRWWYAEYWIGKEKQQAPTPEQIMKNWGLYKDYSGKKAARVNNSINAAEIARKQVMKAVQ